MRLKSPVILCVLALICLFVPSVTKADSVTVNNPDFAPGSAGLPDSCGTGCSYNVGSISDWQLTSGTIAGSFAPGTGQYNAPPSTAAYINGSSSAVAGTIYQDLGVAVLADTTYTLSVDVGQRLDSFPSDYQFGLEAGSTVLDETLLTSNSSITPGTFADETLTFTTGSTVPTGDLTVFISATNVQADFTGVSVATPEPSSLIMLSIGLIGLFGLAKRYGFKPASQVKAVS